MEIVLQRYAGRTATVGDLLVDGELECHTLEDPVRERVGVAVAMWKVAGETAIPEGRYRVTLEQSPHFGPDTLTVHDVPGFSDIRIHAGNTVGDTRGCPLVGQRIQGETIAAGTSKGALLALKEKVRQAIRWRREEVWIEIRNPQTLASAQGNWG